MRQLLLNAQKLNVQNTGHHSCPSHPQGQLANVMNFNPIQLIILTLKALRSEKSKKSSKSKNALHACKIITKNLTFDELDFPAKK